MRYNYDITEWLHNIQYNRAWIRSISLHMQQQMGLCFEGAGLEDLVVQSQPGCVLLQAEALLVNHLHPLFGTLHVQLSVSQIQRRYTNLAANGPAVVQQSEVVLKSVIFEGIRRQSKHHG